MPSARLQGGVHKLNLRTTAGLPPIRTGTRVSGRQGCGGWIKHLLGRLHLPRERARSLTSSRVPQDHDGKTATDPQVGSNYSSRPVLRLGRSPPHLQEHCCFSAARLDSNPPEGQLLERIKHCSITPTTSTSIPTLEATQGQSPTDAIRFWWHLYWS